MDCRSPSLRMGFCRHGIPSEKPGCQMDGLVYDVFVAAAAFEPKHVGLAAKPGELAFSVVPVTLLGLGYGLLAGEFVFEDSNGFGVAERCERATVCAVARDEAFGLFDQA